MCSQPAFLTRFRREAAHTGVDTRRATDDACEESQHCERSTPCSQVGPGFSPDT
jgi:hypothetical protein